MTIQSTIFSPAGDSAQPSDANPIYDVIIVGTGLAGYTLSRELRKRDTESSLLLISQDDAAYYSKPMLSNGLAKDKSAADLAAQDAQAMSDNLQATIINYATVSRIDADKSCITVNGGELQYKKLVLATGALQIKLPIKGNGADDTISVNDLAEYAEFRKRLEGIDRVAVMGPGLIGCEFANDLASIGKTTVIIGPDQYPLERLLPPEVGAELKQGLSGLGVEWHLGTFVTHIDRLPESGGEGTGGYSLALDNGETVEAGLVLSAAGLKPDCSLAEQAGLAIGTGIQVDRTLLSSVPNIYAIGDCAEVCGLVLPYVMPIMHAAKTLAANLAKASENGEQAAAMVSYPGMPVVVKTPAYPLVVASPAPDLDGSWSVEQSAGGVVASFLSPEGELLGFVLAGDRVAEKTKMGRKLPALLN